MPNSSVDLNALAAKLKPFAGTALVDKYGGATPISSQTMAPVPSPQYTTPTPSPIPYTPPVPQTDPNALSQPEAKAQTLVNDIQPLIQRLSGEGSFRAQKEADAGLTALTQTQNDLASQLKALSNEALSIPLQYQEGIKGGNIEEAMRLKPIMQDNLRANAIRSLQINSLLEASRGNLATAMDMVDRSVKAEFDPIRAQIAAKQANLDMILKSPEYTNAEKKRAQEQLDKQKAEERQYNQKEAGKKEITDYAVLVAKYGRADIAQKILTAKTPTDALAIAAPYMQDPAAQIELEGKLLDNKLRRAQIAKTYSEMEPVKTAGAPIPSVSDNGNTISPIKDNVLNAVAGMKLTEGQANAVSFSLRMMEADRAMTSQVAGGYNPTTLGSALGRTFVSDNSRTFEREMENFIRAQLRKESGATITDEESAGGRKIYSPAGIMTNQKDIEQTARTRRQAIDSMITQAGPAAAYLKQYAESLRTVVTNDEKAVIKSMFGDTAATTASNNLADYSPI